ncbi:MAG: DUF3526 domain-containing protein [Acidobacteriota bacterium]|nr:DUF3526 domain-containing protein [Acidobacteriota bacterium]
MIATVIRKEWKQAARDGRFRLAAALLVLLAASTAVIGYLDFRADMNAAVEGNRQARAHWLDQEAKNPHSAAHYGIHVFKEPNAASLFDPGVLPYTGLSVFAEAHNKNDADFQPVRDRTSLARFGNLTPAFFLTWLAPLVIILMHFGSIAREREHGMLRQVAVTGVSSRSWLLGKWTAAWILPVVCLIAAMGPAPVLAAGKGVEPVLWGVSALGYLLYLGSIVNVTMLVSAYTSKASTALLVLLSVWMLGSLALPRLAANTAEYLHPTPDREAFKSTMKDASRKDVSEQMATLKQDTLARYGAESLEDLPVNYDAVRMQTGEEIADRVFDQHYEDLYANHLRQNNVFRGFSVFWPLIPARFLSMGLARTDTLAHQYFNEEAERYRRQFVKILNDDMMLNSKTGDWGYQAAVDTWAKIPPFEHVPRKAETVLAQSLPDLGILAVWFAISAGLLFGRLPRDLQWSRA